MKKIIYLGIAVLMIGAVSCDKIEESENIPAYNPQLPVVTAESVNIAPGASISSGVNLATDVDPLQVAIVSPGEDWPEGFTAEVPFMEISNTEDFAINAPIDATMGENGEVYVNPADWLEAHKLVYGSNPDNVKTYVRFAVNAVNEKQCVRMGGANVFYGNAAVDVVPPANVVYVIGNGSNWGWDTASTLSAAEDNDMYYSGFAYVNGEFKFTKEKNWDDGDWSADGDVLIPSSPSNISLPEVGLYWMTVDLENLEWSNTYIQNIGIVGSFNGWDAGNNVLLTPNENFTIWSGTVDLDGGEWKFNCNRSWDISLGTNLNNLEVGGGSKNVTCEAGSYNVTLYLDKIPYHATLTKN